MSNLMVFDNDGVLRDEKMPILEDCINNPNIFIKVI